MVVERVLLACPRLYRIGNRQTYPFIPSWARQVLTTEPKPPSAPRGTGGFVDRASPHLEVEEDAVEMGSYGRVLTLLVVREAITLT